MSHVRFERGLKDLTINFTTIHISPWNSELSRLQAKAAMDRAHQGLSTW